MGRSKKGRPKLKKHPLTGKMIRFCEEYTYDHNGTAAAIRAGYAKKTAALQSTTLLKRADIQTELLRQQELAEKKAAESSRISIDWVMQKLMDNLNRAMQHEPVRDKDGEPTGDYVYQGAVANKSLELLGKQIGMFKDGTTININTVNVIMNKIIKIIRDNIDDVAVINKIQNEVKNQLGG